MRMTLILSIALVVMSGLVMAGSCPAGATGCFLCGGMDGIPCTTDCTGAWDKNVGDYVSCKCPQGQACRCFCPYLPPISDACAVDPACVAAQMPMPPGVTGYVSKTEGNVVLKKAGTTREIPVTPLTTLNDGDTLIIPDGANAFVVFPGGNIRGFIGEGEVTIKKEVETDSIGLINVGDFVGLLTKIGRQIESNRNGEAASTVTGVGRLVLYDYGRYDNDGAGNAIAYEMESEAVFQVKDGVQSVKVIEGKVTATNMITRKSVTVLSGEQFSSDGAFTASEKKPFDQRNENLDFARGYSTLPCATNCPTGYTQTIFPGCSCVKPKTSGTGSGCGSSAMIGLLSIAGLAVWKRG